MALGGEIQTHSAHELMNMVYALVGGSFWGKQYCILDLSGPLAL